MEELVTNALYKAVSTEENINLLINAIMVSLQKKSEDNTTLRILESELEKTEKAIANIMTAIKMGIITETTKASLEECENMKTELITKIRAEQANEKPKPSREQIRSYITAALKKPTKQMIDLLIDKVVVFNDRIEIMLKYVKGSPTDERPKRLNKHIVKKMNLDASRGSLFMSYDYPYTEISHHKELSKVLAVEIYI
ncbi:MAG: hypothetical protein NC548_57025 [Lachnospiraceae bacterium]|nr:hypothetical protein [Lachnospiraceae bacterium]